MHALGEQGILTMQKILKRPPFEKVQTVEDALAIVDQVANDPSAYQPINEILNKLSPGRSWALYLNTGFHAVSTHTDGHRDMVQETITEFPKSESGTNPVRIFDVGIGNGNAVIAAAIRDPHAIVHGLDIAGAGLNISMWRLNTGADEAAEKHSDPGLASVGRFSMARGSATDPLMFPPQQFDGGSMVLTLFAIPTAQRKQALQNIYNSLKPGAKFVLIDPVTKISDPAVGKIFLKEIVRNAYQNNPDLSALDVALLTAKNAHQLLKINFMESEQQQSIVESVGFRHVAAPHPVYYGYASMQVFEKPW